MQGKQIKRRTKHSSTPTTKQFESVIWIFTWNGFLTVIRDEEKASFLVAERRWGIKNQPLTPILRLKFPTVLSLGLSQTIKIQKLVYPNGVFVIGRHPHDHATNH